MNVRLLPSSSNSPTDYNIYHAGFAYKQAPRFLLLLILRQASAVSDFDADDVDRAAFFSTF